MRSVVREYGALILAILVASGIFAIVCGKGAAISIAEELEKSNCIVEPDYNIYADRQASVEVMSRQRPEIRFCMYQESGQSRTIRAEEEVKLTRYFSAVSMEGDELAVSILSVCREDGQIIDVDEQGRVTFPASGSYIVRVTAMDSECAAKTVDVQIPVMRGEGVARHEADSVGSDSQYYYHLYHRHNDDGAWAFA